MNADPKEPTFIWEISFPTPPVQSASFLRLSAAKPVPSFSALPECLRRRALGFICVQLSRLRRRSAGKVFRASNDARCRAIAAIPAISSASSAVRFSGLRFSNYPITKLHIYPISVICVISAKGFSAFPDHRILLSVKVFPAFKFPTYPIPPALDLCHPVFFPGHPVF
jgi:hypothetical protein